jgi:hypothetical protein
MFGDLDVIEVHEEPQNHSDALPTRQVAERPVQIDDALRKFSRDVIDRPLGPLSPQDLSCAVDYRRAQIRTGMLEAVPFCMNANNGVMNSLFRQTAGTKDESSDTNEGEPVFAIVGDQRRRPLACLQLHNE